MGPMQRIAVGITGASGTVYAQRLIEFLLPRVERVYLVATTAGRAVAKHELSSYDFAADGFNLLLALDRQGNEGFREKIRTFDEQDLFAPIASGTSAPDALVILPCSMGTMARIAMGNSGNLLERAADVILKQKKSLVVCPREMPLNLIQLRNMTTLAEVGASICPPTPAFYNQPKSIDDLVDSVVGKVAELLQIDHDFYRPWNSRLR
jgi:4-hydroxy-3-polyprenylbenzoate decarboxylase